MRAALALLPLLAACMQAPAEGDGDGVLPVAAMIEYNFDHLGRTYPVRLVDSLDGVPGDLTVFAEPEDEALLTDVAEAACEAEGRFFDRLAEARIAPQGITFVGACL